MTLTRKQENLAGYKYKLDLFFTYHDPDYDFGLEFAKADRKYFVDIMLQFFIASRPHLTGDHFRKLQAFKNVTSDKFGLMLKTSNGIKVINLTKKGMELRSDINGSVTKNIKWPKDYQFEGWEKSHDNCQR